MIKLLYHSLHIRWQSNGSIENLLLHLKTSFNTSTPSSVIVILFTVYNNNKKTKEFANFIIQRILFYVKYKFNKIFAKSKRNNKIYRKRKLINKVKVFAVIITLKFFFLGNFFLKYSSYKFSSYKKTRTTTKFSFTIVEKNFILNLNFFHFSW